MKDIELIPNGAEVPVTEENRERFVEAYVHHLLVSSVAKQFDAFSSGFHKVTAEASKLFNIKFVSFLFFVELSNFIKTFIVV